MVTKEEVDKAYEDHNAAVEAAIIIGYYNMAYAAAADAAEEAWDNYIKLKQEFENDRI